MVRAGQMLSELTATSGDLQQTLMQDARSQLGSCCASASARSAKEPEAMKKTDRMRIIRMLYKRRAFTYQKSVAIVAERLNVSRYTVYKYMHELEEAEAAGEPCAGLRAIIAQRCPAVLGLYRKSRQAQDFLLASVYSKRVNLNIPSGDLVHSFFCTCRVTASTSQNEARLQIRFCGVSVSCSGTVQFNVSKDIFQMILHCISLHHTPPAIDALQLLYKPSCDIQSLFQFHVHAENQPSTSYT